MRGGHSPSPALADGRAVVHCAIDRLHDLCGSAHSSTSGRANAARRLSRGWLQRLLLAKCVPHAGEEPNGNSEDLPKRKRRVVCDGRHHHRAGAVFQRRRSRVPVRRGARCRAPGSRCRKELGRARGAAQDHADGQIRPLFRRQVKTDMYLGRPDLWVTSQASRSDTSETDHAKAVACWFSSSPADRLDSSHNPVRCQD